MVTCWGYRLYYFSFLHSGSRELLELFMLEILLPSELAYF